MKLLINEQQKLHDDVKNGYICKEKFEINMLKIKNIVKLGIIVVIQGNREVLHIAYIIWSIE